jgi:ABC-2 type transport system permease protein
MNSRKLMAIIRRELGSYFASPLGYIVLFAYFLIGGYFFWLIVSRTHAASMTYIFQNLMFVFLFTSPLITMRLWSEEEKNGTAELLKTSPLTIWEIVLGKYLGACSFFAVMSIVTLVYLTFILVLGNPDLMPLLANYLGYFLGVMAFFSLGLFASTISENQIISAIISFGVLLILWVIGVAGDSVSGTLGDFLKYIAILPHTDDFFKGVIDLSHVFYLSSLIFLGLFFSVKVLESKRS